MRGKVLATVVATIALVGCGTQKGTSSMPADSAGIMNGKNVVTSNKYSKHTVFIQGVSATGGSVCTGSIYDSQTILTAAHCLGGVRQAIIVFAPSVQEQSEVNRENVRVVDAAAVYPKPRTAAAARTEGEKPAVKPAIPKVPSVEEVIASLEEETGALDDVAVLHFAGGLPEGYEPVTMATSESVAQAGATLHMIGYGLARVSSQMKIVDGQPTFVAVPDSSTTGQLRKTEVAISHYSTKAKLIFTNGTETSVCSGDSGGPAFVTDPTTGQVVQVGIAEAVATEYCNSVSMHTAIFPYLGWIKEASAKLADKANPKVAMF